MSGLRLVGEVTLDGAGFERGLRHLGTSAAENLKSFVVGAAGIYGIEAALHKTIDTADELVTTSKRLAVTVEQLQTLRQAAKDNGVEFTALAGAFEKLDVARAKALGGGQDAKKYLDAFKGVGVGVEDLKSKTAADLFQGQIAATVRMTNPEQIAAPLKEIFGRAFGELIPVMKTDFDELGEKMKKMGAIMDTTTALELKKFKDEIGLISQVITAQLAPGLVFLGEAVFQIVTFFGTIGTYLGALITDLVAIGFGTKEQKAAVKTGTTPGQDAMEYFKNQQDIMKAIRDRLVELNKPSSPNFSSLEDADKKEKKLPKEKLFKSQDSLISVGNFLGAGAGAINNIAEQHLTVARQSLTELQIITKNLINKPNGGITLYQDIEFP